LPKINYNDIFFLEREKDMKKIESEKPKKEKETPIATMVIREYKELNKTYAKTNKRLTVIIMILLMLLAIETTYIVISWESINPHIGIIRSEKCE
jgi:hypothetical protein